VSREARAQRRFQIFDALLRQLPTGRLVDLGAGHGAFSLRAADAGWDVTAVDARDTRFPDDPRVTWVHEDVREFEIAGFDVVACLGLFYHLTLDDQLRLLGATSGTPLILDTHVATPSPTHPLSRPVTIDGYRGRMYSESGWEERATASWRNDASFWPRPRALYRMLAEHGYGTVLAASPWITTDRTFFLCLPD
jgi:methyltransferase family protein